jgi:hypothetical protein
VFKFVTKYLRFIINEYNNSRVDIGEAVDTAERGAQGYVRHGELAPVETD